MNPKDIINKVGADRIRKAMESGNGDELKELFESEGIVLTPEQMDYISGGVVIEPRPTPRGGTGGNGGGAGDGYNDDGTNTCDGTTLPSEEDPFSCEDSDSGDTL